MDQLLAKGMQQPQTDLVKLTNSCRKAMTAQHSKRHQTNTTWKVTKKLMKPSKDTSNSKQKDKTKEPTKMDKSCSPLRTINQTYRQLEKEKDNSCRPNSNRLLKPIEHRTLRRWGNCSTSAVGEIIPLILREMAMSSVMVLELSALLDMVGQRRCSRQ